MDTFKYVALVDGPGGFMDSFSNWCTQDFLEGSQSYNNCLEKAREFFVNSWDRDQDRDVAKQPVIIRLMNSVTVDTEQLKRDESSLPPADGKEFVTFFAVYLLSSLSWPIVSKLCHLDDSWMSVDPATLDAILEEKFGRLQVEGNQAELVPRIQDFLERPSDFEGITPSRDRKKSRKTSHLNPPSRKVSSTSNVSDVSQISNKIGFDPDSFTSAMQGILGTLL